WKTGEPRTPKTLTVGLKAGAKRQFLKAVSNSKDFTVKMSPNPQCGVFLEVTPPQNLKGRATTQICVYTDFPSKEHSFFEFSAGAF
ncbi:MAG: hypothetical protein V4507_15505, partial [Verrucomicrobiota bacterium]